MPKKKIVKPTGLEQEIIDRRLKKQYPHMLEKSWVSKLKKKVRKELKERRNKALKTQRTKDVSGSLRKAGMTQKEIDRLRGK